VKIAIDGLAASGKGTLGRLIASHYNLRFLDTGKIYRLIAHLASASGIDPDHIEQLAHLLASSDLSNLDAPHLSSESLGSLAAKYSAVPEVRAVATRFQRAYINQHLDVVLDGRDIGTVVMPEADVKLYIVASPEVRARRRLAELQRSGVVSEFDSVLADIVRRDERDMGRADSPLRPAADAHLLDTSDMSIEAAFRAACDIVDKTLAMRD
jgi:cytidylate kinase